MFKLKITSKSKYRPGIYYEYVKNDPQVPRIYKLTKICIIGDKTHITFAWDHEVKLGEIDSFENWTDLEQFEQYINQGYYIEIPESHPRISEKLKAYEHVKV